MPNLLKYFPASLFLYLASATTRVNSLNVDMSSFSYSYYEQKYSGPLYKAALENKFFTLTFFMRMWMKRKIIEILIFWCKKQPFDSDDVDIIRLKNIVVILEIENLFVKNIHLFIQGHYYLFNRILSKINFIYLSFLAGRGFWSLIVGGDSLII